MLSKQAKVRIANNKLVRSIAFQKKFIEACDDITRAKHDLVGLFRQTGKSNTTTLLTTRALRIMLRGQAANLHKKPKIAERIKALESQQYHLLVRGSLPDAKEGDGLFWMPIESNHCYLPLQGVKK